MGSTWTKAVLLLAACGAIAGCGRSDGGAVSRPQGVAVPMTAQVRVAGEADPGKYDIVTIGQPADRVEF
jgi:hypothetical protein